MQNVLYFQPQYFDKFICDSSRCNNNCCEKNWNIDIDAVTYEKYLRTDPALTEPFKFDAAKNCYLLNESPCPFLNEKKLCRIQLEHGENFLSPTCRTYPRVICYFGKFFERSLSLSCPVAAEMILFAQEPLSFELIDVPKEIVGHKVQMSSMRVDEKFLPHVINIQAAMISILQERTLSIDQRLIVLGFFLDKLDEISAGDLDEDALTKLLLAYESKSFLVEQVPSMLASVRFDVEKFFGVMAVLSEKIPEEIIPLLNLAAAHEKFGDFRKKFVAAQKIFLENFLVNEIFLSCYPWRFEGSIADNFKLFATKYKIFELMIFSAAKDGLVGKENFIRVVNYFTEQLGHVEEYQRRIFIGLKNFGDVLDFMDSLFDGGD